MAATVAPHYGRSYSINPRLFYRLTHTDLYLPSAIVRQCPGKISLGGKKNCQKSHTHTHSRTRVGMMIKLWVFIFMCLFVRLLYARVKSANVCLFFFFFFFFVLLYRSYFIKARKTFTLENIFLQYKRRKGANF